MTGPAAGGAARELHLYIFERAPRALPPCVRPEGLAPRKLLRAVRRAAAHPWRDARFWRAAAAGVAAVPLGQMAGRDLAQACMAFRRVEFTSPVLTAYCERYVSERRQLLNTIELAAVLLYAAAAHDGGGAGTAEFVRLLADEACSEARLSENVPWSAWRMLVSGAARAGVAHQRLFAAASPHLARGAPQMSGRDAVDVCAAYAAFRFKHHGLLAELVRRGGRPPPQEVEEASKLGRLPLGRRRHAASLGIGGAPSSDSCWKVLFLVLLVVLRFLGADLPRALRRCELGGGGPAAVRPLELQQRKHGEYHPLVAAARDLAVLEAHLADAQADKAKVDANLSEALAAVDTLLKRQQLLTTELVGLKQDVVAARRELGASWRHRRLLKEWTWLAWPTPWSVCRLFSGAHESVDNGSGQVVQPLESIDTQVPATGAAFPAARVLMAPAATPRYPGARPRRDLAGHWHLSLRKGNFSNVDYWMASLSPAASLRDPRPVPGWPASPCHPAGVAVSARAETVGILAPSGPEAFPKKALAEDAASPRPSTILISSLGARPRAAMPLQRRPSIEAEPLELHGAQTDGDAQRGAGRMDEAGCKWRRTGGLPSGAKPVAVPNARRACQLAQALTDLLRPLGSGGAAAAPVDALRAGPLLSDADFEAAASSGPPNGGGGAGLAGPAPRNRRRSRGAAHWRKKGNERARQRERPPAQAPSSDAARAG
ncbi:unnamed protein product [Prorocentrum cordatum]|uniref:Uncharacterized protein n=1 Tax=Prorocentrum cordatum TaxID=2364126 RepID=A0ABN9S1Q7_9DINO|nr:unnamed protein product [Polarella glacialis]